MYANNSSPQTNPDDSSSFASIEQVRGTAIALPSFLRAPPGSPLDRSPSLEASGGGSPALDVQFASIQQTLIPLEIRRKIPGSGINHYDPFDSPIRCEVSPVVPKPATFDHSNIENLFDQFDKDCSLGSFIGRQVFVQQHFQKRQYGRSQKPKQLVQRLPSAAAILSRPETNVTPLSLSPQTPIRPSPGFTYTISPSSPSTSSSESDSSSPSSYGRFLPQATSSFIKSPTPPYNLRSYAARSSGHGHTPSETHFLPTLVNESTPRSSIGGGQEDSLFNTPPREPIAFFPESPLPGMESPK